MPRGARAYAALLLAAPLACASTRYVWTGVDPSTGATLTLDERATAPPRALSGRWLSPQLGEVDITEGAGTVVARYAYPQGGCTVHGSFSGVRRGALLNLSYTEDHRDCGRAEPLEGKAFLLYSAHPTAPRVERLFGSWGYAWSDRAGGSWSLSRAWE